jgi:glycosyltransferase involved in cell wall biosynthesis
MRLSIYTSIRNGIYYDFHCEAMLRHHLPLADEIIVNEGYSTDGTYECISRIDPKIKVFRSVWDRSDPATWHIKFKNRSRRECSGEWCILLDSDEFIPEWEFDRLRRLIEHTEEQILPIRFVHFYGNYRVYKARNSKIMHTPVFGMRIHRNHADITVWGDGANVKSQQGPTGPADYSQAIECHHFGEVRKPARLRQKWRTQARQHNSRRPRWDWVPGVVFDLLPHAWEDPDFLADLEVYDGKLIQAVRDDPAEFVRDKMWLFEQLSRRVEAAASGGGSFPEVE